MFEAFPNFRIAYIPGRAFGHVDALQFIWYRETSRSNSVTLFIQQLYGILKIIF